MSSFPFCFLIDLPLYRLICAFVGFLLSQWFHSPQITSNRNRVNRIRSFHGRNCLILNQIKNAPEPICWTILNYLILLKSRMQYAYIWFYSVIYFIKIHKFDPERTRLNRNAIYFTKKEVGTIFLLPFQCRFIFILKIEIFWIWWTKIKLLNMPIDIQCIVTNLRNPCLIHFYANFSWYNFSV